MLTTFLLTIKSHALWVFIYCIIVTLAMLVDLLTGIKKAKKKGEATTSSGLRKTCEKAYKYYLPILCGACFDFLMSPLSFYTLPFLSLGISAFCVICELKSIFENTHEKEEVKNTTEIILSIIKNKDNPVEILETITKKITEEKNV